MTVPRQEYKMEEDTCNKCIHCTHIVDDEIAGHYYFCEIDNEYITESVAMDETLDCDLFVKDMDDNKTEKQ